MTIRSERPPNRAEILGASGTLAIVRPLDPGADPDLAAAEMLEPFVIVSADGNVTAFNGHVDLGTGIRTALAQIVAEELDVAFDRIEMVLGHTGLAPSQGPTIASETIQVAAKPLRAAAAQARHWLTARAADRLGLPPAGLVVNDGVISPIAPSLSTDPAGSAPDNRSLTFGELIGSDRVRLALDPDVAVKPVSDYRIVGTSQPRVDLAAKATGGLVYVHDMRVPGMRHGRVVRPPYAGVDRGPHIGTSLASVDKSSVGHLAGNVDVVVVGDFVGVVADREEQAEAAMRALDVVWREGPRLPDLDDIATALSTHTSNTRLLLDKGDVDAAIAGAAKRLQRTYVWPYQMHASIGPSCALAVFADGRLTVWSGTQNPDQMRTDLQLLFRPESFPVDVIRMEASGCYGRNGADDVTADAALLAVAVGAPVRVQLTRDQEHQWEPKGAAQLMTTDGGLDAQGGVAAYDFSTRYPSNKAPTLARLLTGQTIPDDFVNPLMGDRTAIGPYDFANHRVVCHDMLPIVRASWLRGVSAMPNSFAHECWIDECASEAGVDPVAYRLRYLRDPRGIDLVKALAERAGWEPHEGPQKIRDDDGLLHGRGFAYAVYNHGKFPGVGAAWSAWVADVVVDTKTGQVALTKITVGQDSGLMINPDGVRHQIHGNVVQSVSRVLKEEVSFTEIAVSPREWGAYPLLTFPELPPIDVMMVERPDQPPLGVGESASVPSAAAIANAIFDATGVRFYEVPFTPERILAGLRAAGVAEPETSRLLPAPAYVYPKPANRWWPVAAAALGVLGAIGLATLPIRPAIAPIARPDPAVYSEATVERGRLLAELGACMTCHTAENGALLAGGHALVTPFGRIYGTNITPDVATGIGGWSYPAFARAMREGISRDGRHLFPAFPYTSFAKTQEADLEALYAFLMAQAPVVSPNRPPELRAPFGFRPLMAAWNTLFHRVDTFQPDPARSDVWNRGAYLVEGLGHCSACHSPRNALGAEIGGKAHLTGGVADGWAAPSLTGPTDAPIPWTEASFYDYLRAGFSPEHGAVAGPMAPVVASLKALPDADIRAMAHYLAALNPAAADVDAKALAVSLEVEAASRATALVMLPGSRIFEGACAVCHEAGRGPTLYGVKPSLTFNSAVHGQTPGTLIRVILNGIHVNGMGELGAMPAFADHLDDAQIADLAAYARARFAADKPAWTDLAAAVAEARVEPNAGTHAGPPSE
jgi:nicotinate dehydrogenase subunit B